MVKKILVLGNYNDAMYHPLGKVDDELKKILPDYELECTDRTAELLKLQDGIYDGVICYLDIWDSKLTDEEADSLEKYVRDGGAFLSIHNGISIQNTESLKVMTGARFITHPKQEVITFKTVDGAFPGDFGDFSISEEPYQFEMVDDGKELIQTYIYRDKEYPAGWKKTYGKGRVVFLTPGHTYKTFEIPEFGKLIRASLEWLENRA